MTGNVKTLFPGVRNPVDATKPNQELIDILKDVLAMAESGQLQSFYGTGFTPDGLRSAVWCDTEENVYQVLGAMESMKLELLARRGLLGAI
jgi:hypothetical protein